MNDNKIPHPIICALPLLTLVAMIVAVLIFVPDEALSGASQMALLIASGVCVALSLSVGGGSWARIEASVVKTVGDTSPSILILLLIGVMASTWMISGVVPTLIYYGVQIMSPTFFLPCACIIAALISVMTGTSWTTIATIGVALMGVGGALGVPMPLTAGAIISGAYFGDKMSPMSDTTVLASSIAGADLFTHIRYMMFTTVPTLVVSLLLYLGVGLFYGGEIVDSQEYIHALGGAFHISWLTMLVPAFTAWLIYKKAPALVTLCLSAVAACVCAVALQPDVLAGIGGGDSALAILKGIFRTCYTSTNVDTGNEAINALIATRGMAGMLNTVWLILCALCFGACMVASNMLKGLTDVMLKRIRSTRSLVGSTVTTGVLLNLVMGDQFLSIIMNASIYKDEYASRGYPPQLLSRSTEDSATVTSVLVPWTACGMTQSTVLGVPTIAYLPFCFFNILSPLMSIAVAALGFVPTPKGNAGVGRGDRNLSCSRS